MSIAKFKEWMQQSTPTEKKKLADKAETSLSLLYQLSYGTRKASSGLAGRIEKAAASMNRTRRSPLPELRRGDLAEDCANCKLYKDCNG